MILRHGHSSEGLRLRTATGVSMSWPSRRFSQYAGGRTRDLPAALRSVLVTDRADELAELDVWNPARVLGDRVTIIDTPGFNVAEAGHRERRWLFGAHRAAVRPGGRPA